MTDQERIAILCTLIDSCISDLYSDSWVMELDEPGEWETREKLVRDYKQKLTELAPSHLHSELWSLKPENITF